MIFHGFGSHARFPSTFLAAEALSQRGYIVVSPDMPGHGESDGLRGYIHSCDDLEKDAVGFVQAARDALDEPLPLFVMGSSMGGALAFRVAQALRQHVEGAILLAPMLAPPASSAVHVLLTALSYTPLNRVALIPSSATSNEKQYSDPDIISQVEKDTLAYKGKLRVGSVSVLLDLGARCEASLADASCPILCLLAEREMVLNEAARTAAERLVETAPSTAQRTIRRFDALHGLLCEREPLRSTILNEIFRWLNTNLGKP